MRSTSSWLALAVTAQMILCGTAFAQDEGDAEPPPQRQSATSAAEDAFGERVGIDQVGLYGESQARGFDLQASGAYRIEGAYFVRAAGLSESVASGLSVRVGVAATALDLPSPSGVVVYRLRDPGPASSLTVTTGLRDYETPHVELLGTLANDSGSWGVAGHVLLQPDVHYGTGQHGPANSVGGVVRWRPDARTTVRAFGGFSASRYDGSYAMRAIDPAPPPRIRTRFNYGPSWAQSESRAFNGGVLLDRNWSGWSLGASAIRSVYWGGRSDFTLIDVDRRGNASATLYHTPAVETRADAGEIRLARTFAWLGADHRIGVAARYRRSLAGRALATPFALGSFTLAGDPPAVPAPMLPTNVPRGQDEVRQSIFSATYGAELGDRFQLRLGAHRSRYDKRVLDFAGVNSGRIQDDWLFNASAIWQPSDRFRFFGSYVTGLEEVGVAPNSAVNRGEVLPPVKARQFELGVRYGVAPGLNLIVVGFDIEKPIYGLRNDGVFALVGDVRHRGIEGSLTGRIGPGTTVVLGAVWLDPRVSGTLVDSGVIGSTPAGVSRFSFTSSIEQRLGDWTLDGQFKGDGPRQADSRNSFRTPGVRFVDLGARRDLTIGGVPATLRLQLLNALDQRGYYATPSDLLAPLYSRTFRVMLTGRF